VRGVGQCCAACSSAGLVAAFSLALRFDPARLASGVGQSIALVASEPPPAVVSCVARTSASQLRGVGQPRAASVSVVPECRPLSVEYAAAPEEALSFAVAVGQDEEALAAVRRADLGRAHKIPLRIEPERGKVGQHSIEPKAKVAGDVLKEDERRSALRDDARDLGPQVPLVALAALLSGDAERLAGVSRSDEIHCATPALAVEGLEIVPDRSAIQPRLFHPGHEHSRSECLPLDVQNTAAPAGQSEIDATDPGAEVDGS
jgi:hypothetical protein